MAIISKPELERYQYGVHVQKGRALYTISDKKIYFGNWLIPNNQQIIIIEMSKQIAEREEPFYLEVNGHKNIIRTFGSVVSPVNLTILVQEYASQGDLADCLMDNRFQFTQQMFVPMFAQIADAMSHVASKRIVHGDLGCRNILVFHVDTSDPRKSLVKITDFGLARWIDRPPTNEDKAIVPIRYCAPEILQNNHHASFSEKSDIYSMGVLIWEALSNSEVPYASVEKDEVVTQKKLNDERLPQPKPCDRQLWVVMNNCWHRDPRYRPTFDEITEKLLNTKISEVPYDLITDTLQKPQLDCKYELDIDVRIIKLSSNGNHRIHEAQWITKEEGPIVLIEKNEEPSEHEKLIYSTFKNHPHIIHTYGFVGNDRGSVMILQERAPYGNLLSLLQSGKFQPSARVLVEIFSQIINAMIEIVDHGLVHGDLCCENILVFKMHPTDPKRNSVKLANFSWAHPNDRSYTDVRQLNIPVRYCALEILRSAGHSNYSELSDVYSLGVLMWQACSQGKIPYESSTTTGEVRQRKLNGEKLPRLISCHKLIWSIMEDCWHNELALRYELKDMKTRFENIGQEPIEAYQFELNKDVKQNHPLNGTNGRFYEADWIPKKDPSIILLVLDGPAAEHEAFLLMDFKSHPHIIHTYGLVKNDRQSVMLLQERALHGDLQTLLQSGQFQPSPAVLVEIFLQIVEAMIYVTKQRIVHGDLRCSNILVFEMDAYEPRRNVVKLTNFSLARKSDEPIVQYRLPDSQVRYCAPEILQSKNGSNYSESSDVYSMGVLMWVACSRGEVPYGPRTTDDDIRQQVLRLDKLKKPKTCHGQIWSVIEYCCATELRIRSTFEQVNAQLLEIKIIPPPPRSVLCYKCKDTFLESEIENHRKSCIRSISPVNNFDPHDIDPDQSGSDNNGYVENEKKNHSIQPPPKRPLTESTTPESPPSKPMATIRVDESIYNRSCKYCHQSYPIDYLNKHQTCCPKRISPPVIKPPPTQLDEKCNNCHEQFRSNEIVDHRRKCQSNFGVTNTEPSRTPNPFENIRPPPSEKKSCWARICSCLFN